MRWLQWSTINLASGLGGVEVHARNLHHHLLEMGIDSHLSSDPQTLGEKWDVIQTHGSAPLPILAKQGSAFRLHILHGTTLGRMIACGEWFWLGGYLAYLREILGILQSDLVLGVQPKLHLLVMASALGKKTGVCWNGCDPISTSSPPFQDWSSFRPYFTFIGRGKDPMKNASFARKIWEKVSARLIAVPGEGFDENEKICCGGRMDSAQMNHLNSTSQGLVLTSHYEGLPLVVLEALAQGVPVFATRVGGLKHFGEGISGLHYLSESRESWIQTLNEAALHPIDPAQREQIALRNREHLKSWRQVTEEMIKSVESVMRNKKVDA